MQIPGDQIPKTVKGVQLSAPPERIPAAVLPFSVFQFHLIPARAAFFPIRPLFTLLCVPQMSQSDLQVALVPETPGGSQPDPLSAARCCWCSTSEDTALPPGWIVAEISIAPRLKKLLAPLVSSCRTGGDASGRAHRTSSRCRSISRIGYSSLPLLSLFLLGKHSTAKR